jgi:hypothetical protein
MRTIHTDPDTSAARAAHDDVVMVALLEGFLTEKGRSLTGSGR